MTRVALGSDSAVIDLDRARRVVSEVTRRALKLRDGGCRWPAGSGGRPPGAKRAT